MILSSLGNSLKRYSHQYYIYVPVEGFARSWFRDNVYDFRTHTCCLYVVICINVVDWSYYCLSCRLSLLIMMFCSFFYASSLLLRFVPKISTHLLIFHFTIVAYIVGSGGFPVPHKTCRRQSNIFPPN